MGLVLFFQLDSRNFSKSPRIRIGRGRLARARRPVCLWAPVPRCTGQWTRTLQVMYWAHDLKRLDGSDDRSGRSALTGQMIALASLESTFGAPVLSTLVLVIWSGGCAAVSAVCAGRRAGDHRPAAFIAIGLQQALHSVV
jgi:hypothetical protein